MLLSKILNNVVIENSSYKDVEIDNICDDSRKVTKGDLFVAVRGASFDGHKFVASAIEKGSEVIVVDKQYFKEDKAIDYTNVQIIKVDNSANVLGLLAANFYDNPTDKIKLVGITGTNGKTTTATLLYKLLTNLGFKVGLISTIKNYICDKSFETINTTPNILETNKLLVEMLHQGCKYCFMEVSSHAVVQHRISGLNFAGGVFTNLTQDHLDYHQTMANYRDAKKGFFDMLPASAFALTNLDDKNGEFMLQNTLAEKYSYSTSSIANFKTKVVENTFEGMHLLMSTKVDYADNRQYELFTPFVGRFNAQNLTAVFGTASILLYPSFDEAIIDNQEILTKISGLMPVMGRFDTLRSGGITAIVDYAHTPDALKNVLSAINDVKDGDSKLITVVGCGGDRDKTKRPLMAQEAVNQSDLTILTSDNPRTEDPQAIIDDMLQGLDKRQLERTIVIPDRRQAIKTACKMAQKGSVILVAGKGHENYQIIGKEKHHFDDKEEVAKLLNQ